MFVKILFTVVSSSANCSKKNLHGPVQKQEDNDNLNDTLIILDILNCFNHNLEVIVKFKTLIYHQTLINILGSQVGGSLFACVYLMAITSRPKLELLQGLK